MVLSSNDEKEKDSVSNVLPPLSTNVGLTSRTSKAVVSGSNGPTPLDGSSSNSNSNSNSAAVFLSIGDDENVYEEDDKTAKKKGISSSSSSCSSASIVHRLLRVIQKVPYSSKILHTIQKLPKSCRYFLLIAWLIWKVVMTVVFLKIVLNSWYHTRPVSRLAEKSTTSVTSTTTFRILHIVTALAEYDKRHLLEDNYETVDRLANILLPVLSTVVQSLVHHNPNWVVDVYLILGFELSKQRYNYILQHLPPGVGLQVWDDATPLGYDDGRPRKQHLVLPITRTLARQHRFVIRDKLNQYDFFTVFEDDMSFNAGHVQYFLDTSAELKRLTEEASKREQQQQVISTTNEIPLSNNFYGDLSLKHARRMIPGFFRVEVLPSSYDTVFPPTSTEGEDPPTSLVHLHIDPKPCCHIPGTGNSTTNPYLFRLPHNPKSDQLLTWEAAIQSFSLREFPSSSSLNWVAFLPGVMKLPDEDNPLMASYYTSGNNKDRPFQGRPELFAQQGGFMISREYIHLIETDICPRRFLPPFEEPIFLNNGLWQNNVEFYSGGFQLFSNNPEDAGCNLQRIIDLDNFSKHLIYHTTNNKQKSIHRERLVKVDRLFSQLHAAQTMAAAEKERREQKASTI